MRVYGKAIFQSAVLGSILITFAIFPFAFFVWILEVCGFFDFVTLLGHSEWEWRETSDGDSTYETSEWYRLAEKYPFASIAQKGFVWGFGFAFILGLLGFCIYVAKKEFIDPGLESERDRIWTNRELDEEDDNFPFLSSEDAYETLIEINGCGPATAKRIIEKCMNGEELTEHEKDILLKADLKPTGTYS